ncbi:hypothetical protein AB0T83_13565 [Fluviibacterium sp. DFM31]|uniref:Component of SufBCD complex n=1 Tax=Meridianimarinicoccus marinus TaxID=3231483 RepID=A0ABV3LBK5_9RHOB
MPTTILDLIDLRSFSNIWYWIFLGVTWSRILTHPMGIPVDMLRAARAEDADARERLAALTEIMVRRHLAHLNGLGPMLVGTWAFALTGLVLLSVLYRVEIAQAVLMLAVPLALAAWLTARGARHLAQAQLTVDDLPRALSVLRWKLQALALLAVFFSALWGMFHNLSAMVL